MALILKDRIKESTTTTGTSDITLGGAVATFDTFQSVMTNGDTAYYAIVHTTYNVDEWEVGLGTWNTGNTLTRTTVLAGSNGTSAVNFSSGTKDIFMTYPAEKAVITGEDASLANITVTGTVDGRDVAADGAKLDGIESGATADQTASEILTAIKTVDGASSGLDADLLDGQEGSYYTGYTDTAIANLVDSAPGTLDTLNELAAALGDDANFSTTVTNSIATKLSLAGGTMTGDITFNSTQLFDGRDVSADGTKLDGIEANADVTDTANVTAAGALMDSEVTNLAQVKAFDSSDYAAASHTHTASEITDFDTEVANNTTVAAHTTKLAGIESGATADQTASEILTAISTVDGSGSGLDADLLDGQHATAFAAASHTHTLSEITDAGTAAASDATDFEPAGTALALAIALG